MNRGLTPTNPVVIGSKAPILVCVPYWKGDHEFAMAMIKLIADLQPHHVKDECHFLLICRQDYYIDKEMVDYLSQKFFVKTHTSTSPATGWPAGPNGMFATTMMHVGNSMANYGCVFWMEPDCVPMCTNWFADLSNIWIKRHPLARIVGYRHDCNGDGSGDHITGCALYDTNIARILPEICVCGNVAWDYYLRKKIVQIGEHTEYIKNRYKSHEAEPTILNDCAVVIHGFKTHALLNLVRQNKIK